MVLMKKNGKTVKIFLGKKRVITRKELFISKEKFHKDRAKMPFEKKIAALVVLQKISSAIKPERNINVWKI
jgi:hypothetical protein